MARAMYAELRQDGIFGEITISALQNYMLVKEGTYSGYIDGKFWYYSQLGIQLWCRKYGYYEAGYYILDGDAGELTWDEFGRMMTVNRWTGGWIYGDAYHVRNHPLYYPGSCAQLQRFLNDHRWL